MDFASSGSPDHADASAGAAVLDRLSTLPRRDESSLAGLSGSPLADRFRTWRGHSGRRYIFSVFPVNRETADQSVPDLADAVVIAVARLHDGSNRILWIDQTDAYPELLFRSRKMAELRTHGATELHVHLLAADKAGRHAVVADLR